MSEVVAELDSRVVDPQGREYLVNVAAEPQDDGQWEGWLEFVPFDDTLPLITGTETTQPSRDAVVYWATGLGEAFLEGAFERALDLDAPLPRRTPATVIQPAVPITAAPVGDPFDLWSQGRDVLATHLRSLTRSELLGVIETYTLNPAKLSLARLTDRQLVTFIVTAVQVQAGTKTD
jgi:hypothetical protein